MTGVAHYTDFSGQVGIAPVAVAIERWGILMPQVSYNPLIHG